MARSKKNLPVMYVANVKTGSIISVHDNAMLRFPNVPMTLCAQCSKFLQLFYGHIQSTQIPVPLIVMKYQHLLNALVIVLLKMHSKLLVYNVRW